MPGVGGRPHTPVGGHWPDASGFSLFRHSCGSELRSISVGFTVLGTKCVELRSLAVPFSTS